MPDPSKEIIKAAKSGRAPPKTWSQLASESNEMDWQNQIRTNGYTRLPGVTPPQLIGAAREAIDRDLRDNYDPAREVEYSNRSYCPDLVGTPEILDLLERSPIREFVDTAVGVDKVAWDGGQIAIRRAHNCDREVPPDPHIDGFASGLNGLEFERVYNHALTVGVFLTPSLRAFAGNFTVWPGSHYIYEKYFRERGQVAMKEPMPTPQIGEPVQLICEAGDAVLSHYGLAHTAAVNTADIDRIAVYFRIWFRDAESNERRWECLTNIWKGWKI